MDVRMSRETGTSEATISLHHFFLSAPSVGGLPVKQLYVSSSLTLRAKICMS